MRPSRTPDPRTGRIARWTEDQLVARFRAGKGHPRSYMPWGMLSRTSEDDLRAIHWYLYLRTVPPVVDETGEAFQRKQG